MRCELLPGPKIREHAPGLRRSRMRTASSHPLLAIQTRRSQHDFRTGPLARAVTESGTVFLAISSKAANVSGMVELVGTQSI